MGKPKDEGNKADGGREIKRERRQPQADVRNWRAKNTSATNRASWGFEV